MYLMAALNLARLLARDTMHGIPTFSSTPLPLNLSTFGGKTTASTGSGVVISILLGGSNAEAGWACRRDMELVFDLVLDVLTLRVGRGIEIETGGNFVGEGAEDNGSARSDTSEPSRRIFGSG